MQVRRIQCLQVAVAIVAVAHRERVAQACISDWLSAVWPVPAEHASLFRFASTTQARARQSKASKQKRSFLIYSPCHPVEWILVRDLIIAWVAAHDVHHPPWISISVVRDSCTLCAVLNCLGAVEIDRCRSQRWVTNVDVRRCSQREEALVSVNMRPEPLRRRTPFMQMI